MNQRMEAVISAFIEDYCREKGVEHIWREPIVKFADAKSDFFPKLRQLVEPSHQMPQDFLPQAENVLCYFLPFQQEIGKSNEGGLLCSPQWAAAYVATNEMAGHICNHLVQEIRAMGYDAAVPQDTLAISRENLRSRWSQRHIAWQAGMGTFGLNNMLISEKGCCGRYFSVVTTLPVVPDSPLKTERCLFRRDGSCGACMKKCPGGALTLEGFDRKKCDEVCGGNRVRPPYVNVCGKCLVGLPCSARG